MKRYIKHIRKFIILQLIFDTLVVLSAAILPYIQKIFFDNFANIDVPYFIKVISIYFLCICLYTLFSFVSNIFTFKGIIKFDTLLKTDFFTSILKLDFFKFQKLDIGDYISIQNNDIVKIGDDYLQPSIDLVRSSITLIIYCAIMIKFINPIVITTIIIMSILTVLITNITGEGLGKRLTCLLSEISHYTTKVKDLLEGYSLINILTYPNINKEHEKYINSYASKRYEYGKYKTLNIALYGFMINFMNFITFIISGILLIKNKITLGTFIATLSYVGSLIGPIQDIIYDLNTKKSIIPIIEKIKGYLNNNNTKFVLSEKIHGDLVIKDVSFHYDNFKLDNINYVFKKGGKYCIIGESGSGKSTLLNLINGTLKTDNGDIYISHLNDCFGINNIYYSNQRPHIYSDSYYNNITVYGSYKEVNHKEVILKIGESKLEFIKLSENCKLLSGGEQQIVAFVRAISSNFDYLLLDEPFSAIDPQRKNKLLEFLVNQNCTIIMVTHNNDDLKYFDNILKMSDGKLEVIN